MTKVTLVKDQVLTVDGILYKVNTIAKDGLKIRVTQVVKEGETAPKSVWLKTDRFNFKGTVKKLNLISKPEEVKEVVLNQAGMPKYTHRLGLTNDRVAKEKNLEGGKMKHLIIQCIEEDEASGKAPLSPSELTKKYSLTNAIYVGKIMKALNSTFYVGKVKAKEERQKALADKAKAAILVEAEKEANAPKDKATKKAKK